MDEGDARCRRRARIGLVGTFPPTRCGIATFTYALARELRRTDTVAVVRSVERREPSGHPLVVEQLVRGDRRSVAAAAAALDACDAVVLQHEYGIYGGEDGDDDDAQGPRSSGGHAFHGTNSFRR